MRASELGANARPAEMVDRRAEPAIGVRVFREQRPGTRLDAARPIRSRGVCLGGEPVEGGGGEVGPATARGGLDQLAQTPVLGDDLPMLAGGFGGGERV